MTHIPEQAVYKAHEHLENAESELAAFIRDAKPKTDQAEALHAYMKQAREELRKYIKKWENDFYEITKDLPALSEDDYRDGGR